jgi:hypothetical protein
MPTGDQWKNPVYLQAWRAGRRKRLQDKWREQFPSLLAGVPLAVDPGKKFPPEAIEMMQWESESLTHRAHRLEVTEKTAKPVKKQNSRSRHQIPALIAKDGDTWILAPGAQRATPGKLEKAKSMYEQGLEKKAQRELACGVIGGEVVCRTGHAFRVGYECGNRYCVSCGPRGANRLFAKHHDRLLFVATRLLLCGDENCTDCSKAIEEKRLPHWPPPRGHKPRIVCAKIDFTLRHDSKLPAPSRMRQLNDFIKKFCRRIEKEFSLSRKDYGLAYCDELGGNNSNPHAHGIYVGRWLPQDKKQLSALWKEITDGSFVLSIKYAEDFSRALYHAVKYPAKFAERSTPARLADLEVVFHRVRRFHTLAAFYAPEAPEPEKPPKRRCPICSEQLSEVTRWETVAILTLRGLPDLRLAERDAARAQGLLGAVALPP